MKKKNKITGILTIIIFLTATALSVNAEMRTFKRSAPAARPAQNVSPTIKRKAPVPHASITSVSVKDSRGKTVQVSNSKFTLTEGETVTLLIGGSNLSLMSLHVSGGVTVLKSTLVGVNARHFSLKATKKGPCTLSLREGSTILRSVSVGVKERMVAKAFAKNIAPRATSPAPPKPPTPLPSAPKVVPKVQIPVKKATSGKKLAPTRTTARSKGSVAIDTVPVPEKPSGVKNPSKAKAAPKKAAGKTEQVGIIDTNTKGRAVMTRAVTEKTVTPRFAPRAIQKPVPSNKRLPRTIPKSASVPAQKKEQAKPAASRSESHQVKTQEVLSPGKRPLAGGRAVINRMEGKIEGQMRGREVAEKLKGHNPFKDMEKAGVGLPTGGKAKDILSRKPGTGRAVSLPSNSKDLSMLKTPGRFGSNPMGTLGGNSSTSSGDAHTPEGASEGFRTAVRKQKGWTGGSGNLYDKQGVSHSFYNPQLGAGGDGKDEKKPEPKTDTKTDKKKKVDTKTACGGADCTTMAPGSGGTNADGSTWHIREKDSGGTTKTFRTTLGKIWSKVPGTTTDRPDTTPNATIGVRGICPPESMTCGITGKTWGQLSRNEKEAICKETNDYLGRFKSSGSEGESKSPCDASSLKEPNWLKMWAKRLNPLILIDGSGEEVGFSFGGAPKVHSNLVDTLPDPGREGTSGSPINPKPGTSGGSGNPDY